MNQSHRKTPFTLILLLLIIGAGTAALAFWLYDHPRSMPGSGIMIAASLGIFFVSYTWALFLYLRRRDEKLAAEIKTLTASKLTQADLEGTVYGLIPGCQYKVMKSFKDFYNGSFEEGELLRFKGRHFLPYHGGHTIVFEEASLYLQEDANVEILDNFSEYIAQVKP